MAGQVNLDSLYRVLDAAIDSSAYYQKQKTDAILVLVKQYKAAHSDQERYQTAFSLYREYSTFVNDSALHYLQVCMDCANRMGRQDLKTESELAMAYQLADTGFYPEAEIHFSAIQPDQLTPDMVITYLSGRNHMYGEMAYYSHDKRLSGQFFAKSDIILSTCCHTIPVTIMP
jgi:hypothetical protein